MSYGIAEIISFNKQAANIPSMLSIPVAGMYECAVVSLSSVQPIVGGVVELPKVSVITVVFNGEAHIEETLLSVLGQTYPNLEYIVIDGGSTDGTVDIIQKYQSRLAYWHSEKDAGIYDAMNKGLAKAAGHWVNFMNAGDTFYAAETVAEVFTSMQQGPTVIYGGVEILYPDLSRIQRPGILARLWQGMQFSHQAAFIDTKYHQAHPYDITNRIAADLSFFYQAYRGQVTFLASGKVIARVITGGVSEVKRIQAILASCDAICGSQLRPLIRLYFYGRVISSMLRSMAKRCLPRAVVKRLILFK